jgi:hypothetical protein
MKKTTPIPFDPKLPVIKIVKTSEETFVRMELEMDDNTHDMLVAWGKEEATSEDYLGIAIRCGLERNLLQDEGKDDQEETSEQ